MRRRRSGSRPAAAIGALALFGIGLYPGAGGAATAASDRYTVGVGVERFLWREYDAGGDKLLEEEGPRYFIGIDGERTMPSGWTYGFRGRLYTGEVDYDGQTRSGTPVESDSDYDGIRIALDFAHPLAADGGASPVSVRFGLGLDWWSRSLQDTASTSGYSEDYRIPYLDLGLTYRWRERLGWYAEGGVKYPFASREEIEDLGPYDAIELEPEGDLSPYLGLGYRFTRRWDLEFVYATYRFDASDKERLTVGGAPSASVAWQPESRQDTAGLHLRYGF